MCQYLEANGVKWRTPQPPVDRAPPPPFAKLSTDEKVRLFRGLFRGRTDVYPVRWESKTTGKSGYAPACLNEWAAGICHKPRIKCADCEHRSLASITDPVIYDHLAGEHTVGIYPLLHDNTCHFLAVDFDEQEWREDALAFVESCRTLGVPAALEISRSGDGAHVWLFFSQKVDARDARRLGTALISHVCARTRQLKLSSYDRLLPNQDTMPKGGFGNLIALPLQKKPRDAGRSVFVDDEFLPYPDQWGFLASVRRMPVEDIEPTILQATGGSHPLDVTFIEDEDHQTPWLTPLRTSKKISGPLPESLHLTLANLVYFPKEGLPQALANRLIRLAAFQNPEFYKAQAMRFAVWDKPRVIGCAENYPNHIALPRGCLDDAVSLLAANGIRAVVQDERFQGAQIDVRFAGTLRDDQEVAVGATLQHDTGVLCAPTAFGKTVTAAAVIARRGVNTLVLVHRTELLTQWQERLQSFLAADKNVIGRIGGGKSKPTGKIDIAVMQSLARNEELSALLDNYGQVIVDECHHIGAVSFDLLLRRAKAKYVLGLTATPVRRDGQHPIIFMQCGPIRHTAQRPDSAPQRMEFHPIRVAGSLEVPGDAGIQDIFTSLVNDVRRTREIVDAVLECYGQGRKILVLTERTDHIATLADAFRKIAPRIFILHGRMSRKERMATTAELDQLPPTAARILLASGKLVGEGFDHPALDTLALAMPVSWRGTLQQYAGRLHREHSAKTDVRILDFVDTGHPALHRMWEKRLRGYSAMGYSIAPRLV
ncbi:type III restriction enzyme, res subunit [Verminephrobacter eiseniae EF01-2]|uniref:Type III restriction enzyme, res subunit n=1 Tax=Verminephrobacter eiseniae (strain EF01-2) TaxID=391735 RepID=A1WDU2_VEREI|nr:type III restriction enzyme, res subunit [Verminephrobacter eiseniae EF01-2]